MSISISFTTETQSEKNETYNLCHVNMRSISLETSDLARKLYKRNINLFNMLNNSTHITSGKVTRHTIIKNKIRTNKLSVPIADSYDSVNQVIAELDFDNGILRPQQRLKFKSGQVGDIQRRKIIEGNNKTILNPDSPKMDDIAQAKLICQSRELLLFQNIGIKTFLFIDNLDEEESATELSYSVTLSIHSVFSDYINHNLTKLQKSIFFLERYLNTINNSKAYDYKRNQFKKFFVDDIMSQVGIDYSSSSIEIDTSNSSLNSSEFSMASKNLYNSSLLLSNKVRKNLYRDTLTTLLPINTSSPEKIEKVLRDFKSLKDNLDRIYVKNRKNNPRGKSSLSAKAFSPNIITVRTKEKYTLERDNLGYNIFSNNPGFLRFTTNQYVQRIKSEQRRYYRKIKTATNLPILSAQEKIEFQKTSMAFLTPIGIKNGNSTIDVTRGIFSVNIDDVREFRLKKAVKTSVKKSMSFSRSLPQMKLGSAANAAFNLSIGPQIRSAIFKKREGIIDPNIDAKEYLGDTSYFVTSNPDFNTKKYSKIFKKLNATSKALLTKIIPHSFLRRTGAADSIKDLSATNKDSKFNKAIISNDKILKNVPPQIKAMTLQPVPKQGQSDVIKNSKTGPILQETQMNIFEAKALVGFQLSDDGFYNVHAPIMKKMDSDLLNSNRPKLIKAFEYELTEIGLTKDKSNITIYNNLLYLKAK